MDKYKPISLAPGYYINNSGTIISYWSRGTNAHIDLNRIPKTIKLLYNKRNNYMEVHLRVNKITKTYGVHVLVCLTFNGPKPILNVKRVECSHLDGNTLNNNYKNLVWESTKDNHARKKTHGTDDRGFRNSRAKINEQQYNEIKNLLTEKKLTHKQIGELYDVGRVFITKINRGHRYNHV